MFRWGMGPKHDRTEGKSADSQDWSPGPSGVDRPNIKLIGDPVETIKFQAKIGKVHYWDRDNGAEKRGF